jgi:hypothetical protein
MLHLFPQRFHIIRSLLRIQYAQKEILEENILLPSSKRQSILRSLTLFNIPALVVSLQLAVGRQTVAPAGGVGGEGAPFM